MKMLKKKDWFTIEQISLMYKTLENPLKIQETIKEVRENLIEKYSNEYWKDVEELEENEVLSILYDDGKTIEDYPILITKITDTYIYGVGGLIKYKKSNIIGVLV